MPCFETKYNLCCKGLDQQVVVARPRGDFDEPGAGDVALLSPCECLIQERVTSFEAVQP